MILISEKLNSSIPSVHDLMEKEATAEIKALIEKQLDANSEYLDINTAIFGEKEWDKMKYLLDIAAEYDCGVMIDSTNPEIVKKAVEYTTNKKIIINSVTLTARFDELVPFAAEKGCGIVALPIDNNGTPATAEERIKNSLNLIEKLKLNGVKEENIYIDSIAEACAVNDQSAKIVADTMHAVRKAYNNVHLICGLSNISYGLPKRGYINSGFLNVLTYCGMDGAILNPASKDMTMAIATAGLMCGNDEYCMDYITAVRGLEE